MEKIRVKCLVNDNRSWDPWKKEYVGERLEGYLVDTNVQGNADNLSPVGIVMLDNGAFEAVPIQFISVNDCG